LRCRATRWSKPRFTDALVVFLVLAAIPSVAKAGQIKFWQLKEAAAAPVLVVGRVLSVQKGEGVADGSVAWTAETLAMTAKVQVLRSYPDSEHIAGDIEVHFLAYGPSVNQFVNGYPPPLPSFEAGRVEILPLQENKHPASDAWQLIADSGVDLIIPARAEISDSEQPAASERVFLDREIANVMSRGTPKEVAAIAGYLVHQHEDLTGELMPLVGPVIGDARERWAEIATNLLASAGIPRPSVADFLSDQVKMKDWPGREGLFLARTPLAKLKASPETDSLLIKTWIADSPLHDWGSANSLLEFGDNPVTTGTLRRALRDDVPGTSYIAWTLVRNGHRDTLPEAQARALKVVDRPDSDYTDLQGAAALLTEYGTDEQLKQLANLVRKYQSSNRKYYQMLWQYATSYGNPRETQVLAVVLRDRGIAFREVRYCDLAVGALERAVGQDFHQGAETLEEWNAAVSRALAWLATHGIPAG
jgi:hypothetical protein